MKDTEFIRGKVPMTKEEVRTLVLSKLKLNARDILMDIGAGTGSVSIEAAQILTQGKVIAIEHKPQAVALIQQNAEHFGVTNIELLHCKAPAGMENLSQVDKYFIGGSGGNLSAILSLIDKNIRKNGIVVVTAIVVDTMIEAYQFFKSHQYCFELIQVMINRVDFDKPAAMLMAQNPVFILSAKR
ncbi:MAG: precorrin-6Y C5,15-methyltransferase (decarboxylating) subunit CbiT [Bacteroidia bacterium]|nr:MAG: precorrin-6Y C5,15-methyltransferase (decarboxylating) subunit CbiT [Bacteroidia bacterium]